MYQQLQHLSQPEQVEWIATQLVQIPSINGTEGEVKIAEWIKELLLSIPYFQEHPEQVWEQPLRGDALGRKNIFALVRSKQATRKTVIFHSHLDTVGVDDFGAIKEKAYSPDDLLRFFQTYDSDPQVQADALSGEWMFGRGSSDMKSGIAVHIANLLYFLDHLDELPGNILLMVNPVEENQHTGVIEAVYEIERLQKEEGLEFIIAINNDFISPLYDGDVTRYIYTGAVGKLLPCFLITGREAHVGQSLTSIDPLLISAEINRRVNNNMELAEDIEGELVLPPSSLLQRDGKDSYNVQTAGKAYLYFNYFIYKASPQDVLNRLKKIAIDACAHVEAYMQSEYAKFLRRTKLPASDLSWKIEVRTLHEYVQELEQIGVDTKSISAAIAKENPDMEPRMLAFKIVEALQERDPEKKARVIIFFAPPYCPHNYLLEDNARDQGLLAAIEKTLQKLGEETQETFAVKKFFPYLSDSSYLSVHDTDEEIAALVNNFPEWETIYPVPIKKIRELNIPSINVGIYGKDAHKWTERVYKPYTFHVLPKVTREIAMAILKNER
ncbi:M20/M25/M40 family metallo-hydrolase [Brevibacillus marinus]|uniref:M20/M25/M40 family metallo-hydrolase n=1 Tax=Brevibacillus marinus TaxID=2496837 RepID=UPI000F815F26|nr:M20/M25/M40 family metallo-hydrolase [Brevibacillus marinus]